jgi:hypothetical protein
MKTVVGSRKTKLRGLARVDWAFTLAAAAYNIVPAPKLIAVAPLTAPAGCELVAAVADHQGGFVGSRLPRPRRARIDEDGRRLFALGIVNATLELEYARRMSSGFDEGDEVSGSGSVELENDGSVEIELSFHEGDNTTRQ